MKTIRVFFTKTGRAKYISHLDITRCMGRALKRSLLPVWFTEGFNPHIYMTFSLPLSLGFESECEAMDIRLIEDVSFDKIMTDLNACLPEGIRVYKVAEPIMKTEKIVYADYDILLELDGSTKKSLTKAFEDFFSQEQILVMKKSKKGPQEVDLKPLINILSSDISDGKINFLMRCSAGINLNINPMLIIDALTKNIGLSYNCCSIDKKQIYTENLEVFC